MDQVRMNLPQRNQRPTSASIRNAQFLEENLAVALDGRARVVLREAKIQRIPAVGARYSALPRREGMHQPSQFTQLFGMQELYLVFCDVFCDAFDHDSSMIPEGLMERRARSLARPSRGHLGPAASRFENSYFFFTISASI